MSRTLEVIEAEIQAVKDANPNWITNSGVMAFITELTREKNSLTAISTPAGEFTFKSYFSPTINFNIYLTSNMIC